ncbi:hypothetical protein C8R43DRAFT_1120870 [Mycena crocata]|nr:hypothetical protein C8R43DRAFT_1120870 [Mycena crocata]
MSALAGSSLTKPWQLNEDGALVLSGKCHRLVPYHIAASFEVLVRDLICLLPEILAVKLSMKRPPMYIPGDNRERK